MWTCGNPDAKHALKRATILPVLAALLVGAAVPSAEAHRLRIDSQHQMDFAPDVASNVFTGRVSSSAGQCERARLITLYRKVGDASNPDTAVETSTTNEDGVWSEGFTNIPPGRYYAVAARKPIDRAGHKHVCGAAKSNTVTVAASAG